MEVVYRLEEAVAYRQGVEAAFRLVEVAYRLEEAVAYRLEVEVAWHHRVEVAYRLEAAVAYRQGVEAAFRLVEVVLRPVEVACWDQVAEQQQSLLLKRPNTPTPILTVS